MKKIILLLAAWALTFYCPVIYAQERYYDEVFTNVDVASNLAYGINYNFLLGPTSPFPDSLRMDVYQPSGDTLSNRPLIVYIHTGSFLPVIQNGNPTGIKTDSATVEMCKEFARRGYVVAAIDYRLGWNPLSTVQDVRTGSLLQAVYHSLQDAKTCVRYFERDAVTLGNSFGIDTGKIAIGGQGSGGYIALAYQTLHDPAQILLEKFIAQNANTDYHWVANGPYVDQTFWGDYEGLGGDPNFNISNWPGYSSNIRMVFNMGGALGDSSWLQPGNVPVVCFHVPNDPYAPYGFGLVVVPFFNYPVVEVAGSREIVRIANELGINDPFNIPYNDPYTTRANMVNEGFEGLFPFILPDPSIIIPGDPFHGQAGPWEWWDSTALQAFAPYVFATPAQATTAYQSGFLTNPDMSKTKALAYIDSMQGYLAPRLVAALDLTVGIDDPQVFASTVQLYPNPAADYFMLQLKDPSKRMSYIQLYDATGRMVKEMQAINSYTVKIPRDLVGSGLYLVRIGMSDKIIQGKIIFN